jgi:hypothetical protein
VKHGFSCLFTKAASPALFGRASKTKTGTETLHLKKKAIPVARNGYIVLLPL